MIIKLTSRIKIELLHIPAGEFSMGSNQNDQDTFDDEKPIHRVYLPEFLIARFPVTEEQFAVFLAAVRSQLPLVAKARLKHPATRVTWYDANEFCQWAGRASGLVVRLPTEAEWEKAARGFDERLWPWGNERTALPANLKDTGTTILRHADGRMSRQLNATGTVPVGCFSPRGDSPFGCVDMSGNVWEWTHTLYRPYPYRPDDGREDEDDKGMRVLRGGSFLSPSWRARCSSRLRQPPGNRYAVDLGFRICIPIS